MSDPNATVFNGRYELHRRLGRGGMAEVFLARDQLLDRPVAVKVLFPEFATDPAFVERFRREATAAANLNHPNIVGVYDWGEADSTYFIVMEYIDGRTLSEILRAEGPLHPDRVADVGADVAAALGFAHRNGVVHRDVKPGNVIVTSAGLVKVADFGIARAIAAVGTTAPGIVLGTVHYIAPEQAAGGSATPGSDVYSLGVVLYEMLTARVPFDADSSLGVAMKIMNEDPEPVDQVNPLVPAVLAGIVSRAMARRPEDRYPDAGALAEALEGYARWSDQATGGIAAGAGPGAPGASGAAAGPARGPRPGPAIPPPHRAAAPPTGPLLDWTGLLLAVIALVALAGLVPLWAAVLARVEPLGGSAPGTGAPVETSTAAAPSPEPGAAAVEVPNVVGLPEADAQARLAALALGVSTEHEPSESVAQGDVIRQAPLGGEEAAPGTVVRLTVSGPELAVVPNVGGDYASAVDQLLAAGFNNVERIDVWGGADTAVGTVLGMSPPAGAKASRESVIHLTVNSGGWLPLGVNFEDGLYLQGVDLASDRVAPGEVLGLVAVWEATEDVTGDYRVRATLTGADGAMVAADEHAPAGGAPPTNQWLKGSRIGGDGFALAVPAEAAPGAYVLWIEVVHAADPAASLPVRASAMAEVEGSRVRVMGIRVE